MNDIRKLFHGAVCFIETEGYVIPRRFTLEQTDYFADNEVFHSRTRCGASITLSLNTEATIVSFAYKFFLRTGVESTFEIYTNGRLTHMLQDGELQDEGVLEFVFEEGLKQIEVYVPHYSEIGFKDLSADRKYAPVPSKRTKVLVIGDSITQGCDSKRSSQTYVNIVKRILNYEILNQGIGGYYYDEGVLTDIPFTPDKIIVAFGTNHIHFSDQSNQIKMEAFFERLAKKYANVKTLVLLHPYNGMEQEKTVQERSATIRKQIAETASIYPNIQLVSTYDMIPHFIDYYIEDFVHPNALGMEVYGNNLTKEIKRIGF